MVRQYKRKGKTPWPDKDKRMAAAVRKRAEGKSYPRIAKELGVAVSTAFEDVRKWERLHPNVVSLPFDRSFRNCPPGGEIESPDRKADEPAPRIRRIQ